MNYSRYCSQIKLDGFGTEGQNKLSQSTIAVIGCGGLGSVAAPYLAGAGIGKIILIDGDEIRIENLHRQIIYSESNKSSKANTLKKHLTNLNSEIEVIAISEYLTSENIKELLDDIDLIIECSDRAETKYLIDNFCNSKKIPLICGTIGNYLGYLITLNYKDSNSPNIQELFPNLKESDPCGDLGVFNTVAGTIGILQSNICIAFLVGLCRLEDEILIFDSIKMHFQKFKLHKKKYIYEIIN